MFLAKFTDRSYGFLPFYGPSSYRQYSSTTTDGSDGKHKALIKPQSVCILKNSPSESNLGSAKRETAVRMKFAFRKIYVNEQVEIDQ